MFSPRSISVSRWAGPWPSVTSTTRQPSASQSRTSVSIRLASPRYDGAREALTRNGPGSPGSFGCNCLSWVGAVPSSASVTPNGAIVHHGRPRAAAAAWTRSIGWNAAAPRSIGASPPAAALTQEASRNSWLVRASSVARVRTRSGSQASTRPPAGT